ncbi:MAG TPA: D-alanyl-D-alanine carboxypeptidase [Saprospiraceae bacterium]|nr:D-alanyl-D-alanine carboxypeptidase [Saprospiraceae bacterium]HPI06446.1 D-alanyl-D-alanine carboxypeptidase [Saprospiraceae bacterium]
MKNSWVPAFLLTGLCFLFFSCSPARNGYRRVGRQIEKEVRTSPVFKRAFTGFTLLDPETGRSLADVNGDHFFTPASTTKILTMYTCLKVLGDSVPGLQKQPLLDSDTDTISTLLIRGTGDPTFLHPFFQAWQAPFEYLKKQSAPIEIYPRRELVKRFGPGWAWDDYEYPFQAERGIFPLYGNTLQLVFEENGAIIHPSYFENRFDGPVIFEGELAFRRSEFQNKWSLPFQMKGEPDEKWLPYRQTELAPLLSDTLRKTVEEADALSLGDNVLPQRWQVMYSTPLDTVLRRMMHQSDNFIAEQMLLVCAGQKFKSLQQDTLMKWVLDSALADLPQRPRWVDGSGLSRYNLISPQDLSTVLLHLWREQPHETLLPLFPAGGKDGTLAGWYAGKDNKPYVFAKSGSMSGVTCLSGYVRTRHGKMLIFTFMTNHFVGSSREWKQEMQRVLERIGESY